MVWDKIDIEANADVDRRKLLQVVGASAVGAFSAVNLAEAHGPSGAGSTIEDFRVSGRKLQIREDFEDYYEITTRRISPDLNERYGHPVMETKRRFEKSRWEKQALPSSARYEIENEDWEADMASEDEWKEYFHEARENGGGLPATAVPPLVMGGNDVDAQQTDWHEDGDMEEADVPYMLYIYDEGDDGEDFDGYERTSPINIVAPFGTNPEECPDLEHFIDVKVRVAGWTDDIAEYVRYGYNRVTDEFEEHHQGAGESWGRTNGGHHTRNWFFEEEEGEFGGDDYHGIYVSTQGHFDSRVPHSATGYECTEDELIDIYSEAFNYFVYPDYFYLDNEVRPDSDDACSVDTDGEPSHNGYATAITWNECSNVGSESTDHHPEDSASGC